MAIIKPFRGLWPRIDDSAFIADDAVIIGDVEIGAESSVWYGCVLRGDVNRIRVGRKTNLQDGTVVHCNHDREGDYRETGGGVPTVIGDEVTVGHMALIHAAIVEDRAFIGMRAVVMDESIVREGGMLAAGALLTPKKEVGPAELWAGSPARFLRKLKAEEAKSGPYLAKHYAELGRMHRDES